MYRFTSPDWTTPRYIDDRSRCVWRGRSVVPRAFCVGWSLMPPARVLGTILDQPGLQAVREDPGQSPGRSACSPGAPNVQRPPARVVDDPWTRCIGQPTRHSPVAPSIGCPAVVVRPTQTPVGTGHLPPV